MSEETQSQFEFARPLNPDARLVEPSLWFQELRILSRLSSRGDVLIRAIPLRPGLNILWSPPEDTEEDTALYKEAWGGHAAGKTLFCRILRFLLGDTVYCTQTVLDSIRGKFPAELWAVARVRVAGTAWVVGRSLVAKEGFATRSEDVNAVLDQPLSRGDFAEFLAQLEAVASASLSSVYESEAWRHFLPWLARDQEARYARVTSWRDSLSEADNPSTSMTKQYALMRAVLGLLDPREHQLQSDIERRDDIIRRAQPKVERNAAVEERERNLLAGVAKQALGRELDLSDLAVATRHLRSHREVRQERLAQLETEPESASVRNSRIAYETALTELTQVRQQAKGHEERKESLMRQGTELMGTVDRVKSAGIVDLKRLAEGWCPRTIDWARKEGCWTDGVAPDAESGVTIEALEDQANRLLTEAQNAETERSRCESRLEMLEAVLEQRSTAHINATRNSRQDSSKLQREVTLLEQCENRLEAYKETAKILASDREKLTVQLATQEGQRKEVETLRKDAEKGLRYMNEVFADVIKAVVGASVDGWLQIDGNGMHLHASKQGELSGAALETVKTLAFDLACLIAGVEGKCLHPRFLIHDGPREADMARVIYEHFFVYAVERLEASFSGEANFQYILTTTTAPPKTMRFGTKWLAARLNSRNKAERLLCEDV